MAFSFIVSIYSGMPLIVRGKTALFLSVLFLLQAVCHGHVEAS
jgi:hypothetical protein